MNVRNKWSTLSTMLFVVYGSCLTIVLPQTYLISYMAFGVTHMMVRAVTRWQREKKERERLIKVFKF